MSSSEYRTIDEMTPIATTAIPRENNSIFKGAGSAAVLGPDPSFIQVANPYIFEQKVQGCLTALGSSEAKEDNIRLQGVLWIDSVRKALQLPIRTFNTAVVYYHKFRLVHADNEYMFIDAAAAALFTACKIEDTLKKSREILCAAFNLKAAPSEHLSPDDQMFDGPSKTIVGLERLMLESAGFDFRNRHPQRYVIKMIRSSGLDARTVGKTAYNMCIDIYRTFAPLKQTAPTLALACVELAARVCGVASDTVFIGGGDNGDMYRRWWTSREEVLETVLDLLDLYTHHPKLTVVGTEYPIDSFINTRITLNKESTSAHHARYTEWTSSASSLLSTNPNVPSSTSAATSNGSHHPINGSTTKPPPTTTTTTTTISPNSPSPSSATADSKTPQHPHLSPPDRTVATTTLGPISAVTGARSRVGERSRDSMVRFMLHAQKARDERAAVGRFLGADEWEEWEEEVEVPVSAA
ncbi:hypothetical protein AAFC00_002245 [Neodothiora populina]